MSVRAEKVLSFGFHFFFFFLFHLLLHALVVERGARPEMRKCEGFNICLYFGGERGETLLVTGGIRVCICVCVYIWNW